MPRCAQVLPSPDGQAAHLRWHTLPLRTHSIRVRQILAGETIVTPRHGFIASKSSSPVMITSALPFSATFGHSCSSSQSA